MKKATQKNPQWNLKLLYKSPEDPQIEVDLKKLEKEAQTFASRFDVADKKYMIDETELLTALTTFEKLAGHFECKAYFYFNFMRDTDGRDLTASSALSLITNRITKAQNKITFFEISLGLIAPEKQELFLKDSKLAHFRVFLKRIFDDAKHMLTIPEEKILNLKSQTSYDMWVDGNERALSKLSVKWKGKVLSLPEADHLVHDLANTKERHALYALVNEQMRSVSAFAESEINAVYTDKKINDELRKYKIPFESTVRSYRNDPAVVAKLVKTVSEAFPISQRFYKIKARLLKLKKLSYADRNVGVGKFKGDFPFDKSLDFLKKHFGAIDPKYSKILQDFTDSGQIDVLPRIGKKGGAYCWGGYTTPTFIFLNHTGNADSLSTFAHEMGHGFHTEFSKSQGPLYSGYSLSLAETASTLFQAIAFEAVFETLGEKEKIIALYEKITDDVSTVFRQIACFNFELELHKEIREKGFIGKEVIAELHNKNMKAYLGPIFDLKQNDGYFFIQWGHIRRFFYVYSYAYGQLVSKAMLRRYRQDKSFWNSIEKFLSAGGKASPEEILMEIGIDVSKPEFWKEGLKEIEADIIKLEKLVKGK